MFHFALVALLPLLAVASPIKRASSQYIVAGRDSLCLSLPLGVAPANNVPVTRRTCDPEAATWDISYGSGSIVLSGTGFCLDAGSNPSNNGALKLYQCYPGLFQQTWYFTNDQRIAITGGTQCLDEGDSALQTYQCTPGNTNQVFHVVAPGGSGGLSGNTLMPPGASVTTTTTSVSSTSAAPSASATPIATTGFSIRNKNTNLCLKIAPSTSVVGNGTPVVSEDCGTNTQNWQIAPGSGQVQVTGTNLCLDAFPNPHNNGPLQVWTCNGNPQQQWFLTGDNYIAITGGNQCLDFGTNGAQTYQCTFNNSNQMFNVIAS